MRRDLKLRAVAACLWVMWALALWAWHRAHVRMGGRMDVAAYLTRGGTEYAVATRRGGIDFVWADGDGVNPVEDLPLSLPHGGWNFESFDLEYLAYAAQQADQGNASVLLPDQPCRMPPPPAWRASGTPMSL